MKRFLYLIVILYALLATLYVIYTPKWQAPDVPRDEMGRSRYCELIFTCIKNRMQI